MGPFTDGGRIVGVTSVARDITARTRAEAMRAGQTRVLELLAAGRALADVMEALLETVERRLPDLRAALFLFDGRRRKLSFLAGPSLPEAYGAGLDGLEIGLDSGPLGTACDRRERVVVADVASDPTVQEYRELLLKAGLRSCWAEPVLDGHGRLVALLAIHGGSPREPTAAEIEILGSTARLAELAIERRRAEQELRDSEEAVRALHAIASAHDVGFDEQVRQLLALGRGRFGLETGMLTRRRGEGFEILQVVDDGDSPKPGETLPASELFCGETVESSEPLVRAAPGAAPAGATASGSTASARSARFAYLGARVSVRERVWGTLAFFGADRGGRPFTPAETDWLQLMARWIGSELAHAERRRDLELARFSVEHGSDAAFWLDPDGRVVHTNEAACRLLDYSREELLSTSIADVDVGCLGNRGWAEVFDEVRQNGQLALESSQRARDGRIVPVELFMNHLRFDGRDYVFAFAREIGERKQTERTLHEATERYRVLFDQSPDAVVLVDPATSLPVEFNDVILNILGYEREEFASLPIHHHEVGSSPERVGRRSREMVEKGGDEFEMRLRTRAGDVRDMIVNVRPIELAGRTVLHGVLHDITERKNAERVLRESEERFSKAFKSSPLPVLISDLPDGRLIDVNDRFLEITGYSRDEVIGRTSSDLRLWADVAERPKMHEDLQRAGSVRNLRVTYRTKEDELRTALLNVERVELGGKSCTLATAEDITERDREAAERERLENLLQHSQKMEALGQLAGGVAHDFNNILTAILGNTEMLLREADEDASVQAVRMRGQLEQIRHAGERAAGLTRQLLAFSRKQVRELAVLAPARVIGEMHGMMRRLIGEHIRLETRFDPDTGHVMADEGQLEQLVLNLALNARDSMGGGGTMTIETSNVDLDEASANEIPNGEPGPYVRIRVTDTGCGMSPEMLDHIFEPFFTTKPVGKGTGLGLATVYGIVSQTGGHLRVDSEPGQGTEIEVLIPRVPPPERRPETEPEGAELRGTETVLVCEDEDMVRDLACRILRSHGYRVLRAENGRRALDLVRQCDETIELLVTDTIMPEMSGTELAEALEKTHPEMKVLFVSGYAPDVLAPHGVPGEQVELLPKPFSATDLLRRVRGVLDGDAGDDPSA
jgi:PAS domain S-box-containing protein